MSSERADHQTSGPSRPPRRTSLDVRIAELTSDATMESNYATFPGGDSKQVRARVRGPLVDPPIPFAPEEEERRQIRSTSLVAAAAATRHAHARERERGRAS